MSIVVTSLMGGLGNQMFQYAAARAVALRCGAALKLDLSELTRGAAYSRRHYELGTLPIRAATLEDGERDRLWRAAPSGAGWRRKLRRLLARDHRPIASPIYREVHFHFDEAVLSLRPPVHLYGYWQSERYFLDCADAIRREFAFPQPSDGPGKEMSEQIDSSNSVSLHVRRGDYVVDPKTNEVHGVCSLDYYRRAVDHIRAHVPAPHIFVFSDDQQWARANLKLEVPTTIVDFNSPEQGHRDMHLMMRCRHHIIANSSFSWWGAWLSPSCEKIVIAPRRWFNDASRDTRDLIPMSWVRL